MIALDVLLNDALPPARRQGPEDWPAEVREVPEDAPPPPPPWRRMTRADYDAYRAERLPAWEAWHAAQPPPRMPVPQEVTNFQARAALMQAGLFQAVDDALRAAGGAAWQAWEYANVFTRGGTLVNGMAAQLGLTDAQLDDLFRAAALIEA